MGKGVCRKSFNKSNFLSLIIRIEQGKSFSINTEVHNMLKRPVLALCFLKHYKRVLKDLVLVLCLLSIVHGRLSL